ncbi:hypothetical protein KIN20_006527 [Parelaphostrongylus tenuis]|uniref:Uncharacterized protein n=1 Tax=Parelaphostrongylus tenuis TaxID=148309 RepID=A0AAD5MMQ5_PARTN|nr:hypothetical protein KIN20_006527 [Parelaphostrongylus tenuis]
MHEFPQVHPKRKHIKSIHVCFGRPLAGYPFNLCLAKENYLKMEKEVGTKRTTKYRLKVFQLKRNAENI